MSDNRRAIGRPCLSLLAVVAHLFTAACCPNAHQIAQAPPPPPEPCPAPATPPPAPPPPPPPKCEALQERCEATGETRVAVGENSASFQPPTGWIYAREERQSLTASPDNKAWIAFTEIQTEDSSAVLAAVEQLTTRLQVDKVRANLLKDRLKKPQHKLQEGPLEVKLWEVDQKSQFGTEPVLNGAESGTVLVLVVPIGAERVLVGTAFVTSEQGDTHAPLVMQCVQSLAPLGATGNSGNAAATTAPQDAGQ